MPFVRAGQLARPAPSARVDDPLGLVAENLRASNYDAVPVLDRVITGDGAPHSATNQQDQQARVLGLIEERDLSRAALPILAHREARREAETLVSTEGALPAEGMLSGEGVPGALPGLPLNLADLNGYSKNGHAAAPPPGLEPEPADVLRLTANDVMRRDIGIIPAAFSLHNVLLTLDRYDSSALPVVDQAGHYRGMISRADVLAALGHQVRPPMVGGMATPLGVWLTTGSLNAGAPLLGLFLSGAVMAGCWIVAHLVLLVGLAAINQEWAAMFESGRLGSLSEAGNVLNLAVTLAEGLLFLLALRLLPMAGTHAAEHQTVWAIERGLPLTPEVVAKMPRAHPRCGTNLVALAALIRIGFQHLPDMSGSTILMALLFIYLLWRNLGTLLQEWFTTRPATRQQLESGIRAGQSLLEKYQEQPHVMTSFGMRLFNSGIVLAATGMILLMFIFQYVEIYAAGLLLR